MVVLYSKIGFKHTLLRLLRQLRKGEWMAKTNHTEGIYKRLVLAVFFIHSASASALVPHNSAYDDDYDNVDQDNDEEVQFFFAVVLVSLYLFLVSLKYGEVRSQFLSLAG